MAGAEDNAESANAGGLLAPEWRHSALVTIDVQNDFSLPGAPAEVQGTHEILPALRRLLEAYRTARLPIVHVIRLYKEDGSNVDLCRREAIERGARIVAPGSDGAELVDVIKPEPSVRLDADELLSGHFQRIGPNEWIVYKPRWGAFYRTDLELFLRERGISTLTFCGCNFPNCPRTSIYEASERDFRVVLAADAVSGVYERGLRELAGIGVQAAATKMIVAGLNAGPADKRSAEH
ncbi:cysteine hydrolase family protein [Cohnella zeiphila]|uniref:Cysteine hydrolase n=1 Tax=Cohnella zeiphila TaxID=2761120 RepID=A0A7X0SNC1_9BACL|nr:isochorismatase family cysteine hydrolase [Cohnella zeiphila]MBB6733167.1 cysteine hydrolase [Cohnella zeiphila]